MTFCCRLGRCLRVAAVGVFLTIVAAGCTPHPRPGPASMQAPTTSEWKYAGQRGTEIRTEHWTVYTTGTRTPWFDSLPQFLEACHDHYQQLVPAADSSRSLTLYVFANALQWEDFATKKGAPAASIDVESQIGGFSRQDVSAVYIGRPIETLRAIAHVGMHQYLWQHSHAEVPSWVSEGLATLAEGFDQQGKKFVFESRYNDQRFQQARLAIQKNLLLDLHQVLTLEGLGSLPNRDVAARAYLAQLWTVATFLQNSKEYRKGFEQMRMDLASDAFKLKMQGYMAAGEGEMTPGEAAFHLYITEDESLFWQRYYDKTIQYLNLVR